MGLSTRSQRKLVGLHPQLVIFVYELMNEMNRRKRQNLNDIWKNEVEVI